MTWTLLTLASTRPSEPTTNKISVAVMNASALLQSQGWRGKGHSLHKTDDSIGLAKPLLLNRKDNTKGLGTTQHFTSDQWWMNAFDEQLKGLETSKEGKVTQTVKTGKLNAIEKGSLGKYSLYLSFVRGGFLEGTSKTSASDDDESSSSSSTCSGADNASDETPATSNPADRQSKKDRKVARKDAEKLKEDKAKDETARRAEKEEKRAKKEARRRREEKQLSQSGVEETREERKARKAKEKRSKEGKLKDKMERRKNKEERRAKKKVRRREKQRPAFSC
ncbi:hypothetical protein C2857_002705 [Epichloe festucae Fl1]|uniref:DNA-directed RNA polymerase II subunit RPB1 n=1 Tax=Epichloe festucae (strain Fl1) TaxID=877507 RepID=A0A7S9KNL2_EPIFF|nr:hypothetical protein C2857_002705 [Epichloe festucae Fl1]